jgi:ABC-2 type transport system ATP-binding protein
MRPTDGEVLINGLDIYKHYMKVKKMLGFIPDTPFLYENLTPIEFLKFIADIFHLEPRNFKNRVDYYFGLFNLDKFRNTLIKELSHGMRQKIVYIANFIHQPSIYLIDEPLVGLDPYSIHLLKRILKEKTAAGATILMCTHILSIAEELADRIGILHHGRIIAQGRAGELKNKLAVSSLEEAFLKITCQSP